MHAFFYFIFCYALSQIIITFQLVHRLGDATDTWLKRWSIVLLLLFVCCFFRGFYLFCCEFFTSFLQRARMWVCALEDLLYAWDCYCKTWYRIGAIMVFFIIFPFVIPLFLLSFQCQLSAFFQLFQLIVSFYRLGHDFVFDAIQQHFLHSLYQQLKNFLKKFKWISFYSNKFIAINTDTHIHRRMKCKFLFLCVFCWVFLLLLFFFCKLYNDHNHIEK